MNIKPFIFFTAGAALGAGISYVLTRRFDEQRQQKEIDDIKTAYGVKYGGVVEVKEEDLKEPVPTAEELVMPKHDRSTLDDYAELAEKYMAKKQAETTPEPPAQTEPLQIQPEIILPEEFGEILSYDHRIWTYYEDGVLEDELGNVVEDIDETVGRESLNHFGEYAQDTVYIRNDHDMTYYEIEKCHMNYADMTAVPDEEE